MTTAFTTTGTTNGTTSAPAPLWRVGALSGVVAAAATTAIAMLARAADIALAIDGEEIPLLGFAQLTLVGALIGVVLAKGMSRWARRPRRTFVVTTLSLTALSLIPDAIADTTPGSKVVLMLTHVVAAVLIVPAVAARLDGSRRPV